MGEITEADRDAARQLQVALAEVSGFWHNTRDDGALCLALARHRIAAERRMLENAVRFGHNTLQFGVERHRQTVRRSAIDEQPAGL